MQLFGSQTITNLPELKPRTTGELSWAPIALSHRIPYTGSTYPQIRDALTATFGPFPIKLRYGAENVEDANVLRGMAAASGFPCYTELHDALLKYHALLLTDQ